jgi:hypothetical protein
MNTKRAMAVVLGVGWIWLALSATTCLAAAGRSTLDKLLKAVEANDYINFVADADDFFKAGVTKEKLDRASAQFSPRMKKGYQCSYLGELRQQGCRVMVWKLVFKDGGDDTLVKLALKDGKADGFWMQ